MAQATLVVPCYNEEARLQPAAFAAFLARSRAANLLFVDDGSRDGTAVLLRSICAAFPDRASLLQLPLNRGKAEAVRQGILAAARDSPAFVGFWDADLATPLETIELFLEEFDRHPDAEIVLGSRVQLLGRQIERRPLRHYAGRGFATAVSLILRLGIYDSQCGAKLFRRTSALDAMFGTPFLSRWIFDVEILARLDVKRRRDAGRGVSDCVRELPLPVWKDVAGSKIRPLDSVRVARDLWRIHSWLRRARTLPASAAWTAVLHAPGSRRVPRGH